MTNVDWHPYPEKKPDREYDYFLITVDAKGYRSTTVDLWTGKYFDGTRNDLIIAWAELPEPYQPEKK